MFEIVKTTIDNWDPYRLFPHAPENEYDTESAMVAAKITVNSSIDDIANIICDVFSQRFFPKDFQIDRCKKVAENLKTALNKLIT